mmetsp:Transcript_10327/g.18787  ORF Transcript_10327/g.18787 Transcript_10327/m.18787 type:complete len:369 (-) Transcript_10327:954-2060(-)
MGTDAVEKRRKPARLRRRHCLLLAAGGIGAVSKSLVFWTWKPASFVSDLHSIPPHCQDYAARFHHCQQNREHTLVIGCHRKFCGSFGYCSPGGGLGSRTRYALTMIQHASVDLCIRVEIDAPSNALLTADDVTYRDPAGLLAEVLHFRSYGNKIEESREAWKGDIHDWTTTDIFYLHMTPRHWKSPRVDGMPVFDYDPCLFHLLFRPSLPFQMEIHRQYERIGSTIGIHFRTGDAVAFNKTSGGDVRVSTDLGHALEQLVTCARDFAERQGISAKRFYLATDSHQVQELAHQHDDLITLELQRHSWRHYDDWDAWLEVFLLSNMAGIVVNELKDKNYRGVGDRISTYARLAAKIGFMKDSQLYPCKIQ